MNVNMESKLAGVEISLDLPEGATWLDILEKVIDGLRAFGYQPPPTSELVNAMDEVHMNQHD